jgi:hypothetical protein
MADGRAVLALAHGRAAAARLELRLGVEALERARSGTGDRARGEAGRAEVVVGRTEREELALGGKIALATALGAAAWNEKRFEERSRASGRGERIFRRRA